MLVLWLACADPPPTAPTSAEPPRAHASEPPSGETCFAITWLDADGDGLGDPSTATAGCGVPPGRTTRGGDCDDSDPSYGGPLADAHFVDVSAEAGLAALGPDWSNNVDCGDEVLGGGLAVGDVDGDGDQDLFVPRMYLPSALLLNDGAGRFSPSPDWVGRSDASNGALFVDVDGDRDLDLVVTALGRTPNLLYVNDGAGRFTEEGALRGIALDPSPECGNWFGASAADVDRDGDLDLLIASWHDSTTPLDDRTRLFLNDGTGHFVDRTAAAGLDGLQTRAPFGGLFADRDRDGFPDLHLVADWNGSGLFLNRGGAFAEVQAEAFTDEDGMGGALADIDGDGDLDWFVTSVYDDRPGPCPPSWGCTGNRLYVDAGHGTFEDRTDQAGVREGQWSWGTAALDYDEDGLVDLVLTGGFPADVFYDQPGRLYHGLPGGRFEDRTCEAGWMPRGQGRSVVPFDADGDGDEDLVLQETAAPPALYRNEGYEDRGWLEIELDWPGPNPFGIGAEVTVIPEAGGPRQLRLLDANPLYVAGHPPLVHFGTGAHTGPVDEVEVRWPDGVVTSWEKVGPGRVVLRR